MTDEHPLYGVASRTIEAGCEILYYKIPEAFEPEFRSLVARMFVRMKMEEGTKPTSKPTKPKHRNSIDARVARLQGK